MKAQELRIGNWVELNQTGETTYTTIQASSFSCNTGIYFKPIPLTEEWLLKFGFEIVAGFYLGLTIENWEIHYSLRYKKLTIEADGCYEENGTLDITEKVKYVHQLQNLVHALTGEELTIKP